MSLASDYRKLVFFWADRVLATVKVRQTTSAGASWSAREEANDQP